MVNEGSGRGGTSSSSRWRFFFPVKEWQPLQHHTDACFPLASHEYTYPFPPVFFRRWRSLRAPHPLKQKDFPFAPGAGEIEVGAPWVLFRFNGVVILGGNHNAKKGRVRRATEQATAVTTTGTRWARLKWRTTADAPFKGLCHGARRRGRKGTWN